ncbi:energy transducer TonB [Pedobacter arcticus]|uniref:energy transducer TonB n=1 Tax=Pedobacter arcticus TaxID=752140 RepID=UPI00031F562E|nr:energy transducer TonB [Pedobacter arcticus]
MEKIFTLIFTLSTLFAIAQKKQTITYYDINSREIKNTTDTLYSKTVTENGNNKYKIIEIYNNGKIKFEATMKGIKPNLHYLGRYISYNKNGNKQTILNFSKNGLKGNAYFFYPNGNLKEHRIFLKRDKKTKENHKPQNYKIMQIVDSLGNAFLDGKGNGRFSKTLNNGDTESGKYLKGFKTGLWKSYNAELNENYEDEYFKNKFIKGKTIQSDGIILNYTELQTDPIFAGGQENFEKFLQNNSNYSITSRKTNNNQGRIYLSFVVERTGELANFKVIKGVSAYIVDAEALRIMKSSPNWIPGKQRGKSVRVNYGVPIFFSLKQ